MNKHQPLVYIARVASSQGTQKKKKNRMDGGVSTTELRWYYTLLAQLVHRPRRLTDYMRTATFASRDILTTDIIA